MSGGACLGPDTRIIRRVKRHESIKKRNLFSVSKFSETRRFEIAVSKGASARACVILGGKGRGGGRKNKI